MHTNTAIQGHPLIGAELTFRPDLPPYDPTLDTEPGVLIAGHGMTLYVLAVFHDWNAVPGLDMLYVRVLETGMTTHFSPREIDPNNPPRA